MRVALFMTCLVDGMMPGAAVATVTVLERLGVTVEVPLLQTCCGEMHTNTGYGDRALPLVKRFADAFAGFDAVVTPSASCAGAVRHQHLALAEQANDRGLIRLALESQAKTYELSEFLVDVLGVDDVGACYPHRVTYHPTCHALRVLRVGDRPLQLLRHVRELQLVELPDAEVCCGFGGTFAIKNPDVSAAMLTDKVACIADTGASVCAAGDASCMLHIGGGLSRAGAGARMIHLAEILASQR